MANSFDEIARARARSMRSALTRSAQRFSKGKSAGEPIRKKTVYIPNKRNQAKSFTAIEVKLKNSIKTTTFKKKGVTDRIKIEFAYHGFFVERGIGPGRRSPSPWFNAPMKKEVEALAEESVKYYGDATVRSILL